MEQRALELVGQITAYEMGELDGQQTLQLFSQLIKSKLILSLQGHYLRVADQLINRGYLTVQGTITELGQEVQ